MRTDVWSRATFVIPGIVIVLFAVVPHSERFAAGAQATVAGTGTLSGTVDAPRPFKAAQVFVRNTDNNIMYLRLHGKRPLSRRGSASREL